MSNRERSRLGLDEPQSVWQRLWLFIVALILGPLVGLVLFAGVMGLQPPWQSAAEILGEALLFFWIVVLIYIWWRPFWFRRVYLSIEHKLILATQIIGAILAIYFGASVLMGWLRQM